MNADIYMMCEVPATVKTYRSECSISEAYSHFFPNKSPCRLHNVRFIHREQIARNFRISNENEA